MYSIYYKDKVNFKNYLKLLPFSNGLIFSSTSEYFKIAVIQSAKGPAAALAL